MNNMENMEDMIQVLKVDKELDELILDMHGVLIEVVNTSKAGLILDNNNLSSLAGTQTIYWEIVRLGEDVSRYVEGQEVLVLKNNNSVSHLEIKDKNCILTDEYNIKLAADGR